MPTIYGPLDIVKNEIRNAVMQNLGSAPASPVKGLMYFSTADNTLYWYDGTQWIAAKGGAGAVPSDTVTTQAVGDAAVPGSSALYSRGDHKHGREAFGTITAETTFGTAKADGSAATLARSDHGHGNPAHDDAAHAAIHLNTFSSATGPVNVGNKLSSVTDPTASSDAATKNYVDNLVNGLSWKDTCRVATTANLAALSGLLTVDGVTVAANDRVLVKNQTTPSANGIYVAASGAWTRALDADIEAELLNASVFVSEGTTQADTSWVMTANAPITVGSTSLPWAQTSGAGAYIAGGGLTLTGTTFDIGAGTGITVAADSISVDSAAMVASLAMARKIPLALTGTSSPEVVTHNLGTRDVQVTVLNGASPYTAVEVDWDATTTNTVTIRYNPNLGAGYRCVVVG